MSKKTNELEGLYRELRRRKMTVVVCRPPGCVDLVFGFFGPKVASHTAARCFRTMATVVKDVDDSERPTLLSLEPKEATPTAEVAEVYQLASRRRKSLQQTSGKPDASASVPDEPPAPGAIAPVESGINQGDEILGRFRVAWEESQARTIWMSASAEIQARIIGEVLQSAKESSVNRREMT